MGRGLDRQAKSAMSDDVDQLPDPDRRLHRALLDGILATGAIPSPADLATATGIDSAELPRRLAALAAADYLALGADGWPTCLYPFSPTPTPHVVVVGERRRYAMCSIDALGVASMLGQSVAIAGRCGVCGAAIRLDVTPGVITRAEPPDAVVVARRSGDEPACEACCPYTLFACGPLHGRALASRLTETTMVPLEEALRHAESIFAGLLDETLPARRPRSQLTTSRLQT
jgi:hypothetical protein